MLSVVIPAHDEAQSVGATVPSISSIDPRARCVRSHNPGGFGFAVRSRGRVRPGWGEVRPAAPLATAVVSPPES